MSEVERWNHNIHYHPTLLDALPATARRVLDVGCGDGLLTVDVASRGRVAVGLDLDAASLSRARARAGGHAAFVRADMLRLPFADGTYDAVVSIAAVHFADPTVALAEMARVLRPGGVLAIVGVARSELPRDLGWEITAAVAHRFHRLRRRFWEHSAPTLWPPPHTYRELRRLYASVLPDAVFRRRLLWRYTLIWTKPAGG